MVKINPAIFRSYDIRGINEQDLTEETAELIGKGFGTYLLQRGVSDVLVGRDARVTSKNYQKALTKGLLSTGCNIFDIGLCLASHLYHARHFYDIDGGVMVTASHNPPNYNGFKLCHGVNAVVEEEIQKLKDIILGGEFETGRSKEKNLKEANQVYYREIKKRIKLDRRLKVAIDCGHQAPAIFLPKFLEELGCEVFAYRTEIDSSFPAGVPDPVNTQYTKFIVAKVKENKADVGVILDADGDRIGFVDERGGVWMGDMVLDIFVRDFLPRNPGAKVIVELKDSEVVVEDTKRLGGMPIFWKTGHALLDHKVHEEKALLCGEMSCHYWITKDWYVFDDAIFAMAHLLRIVSESNRSLGEIMDEIPKYPSTPEIRFACPEDQKEKVTRQAVGYFKEKCERTIEIDGIRGYIYNGWFLLRKSNTQPMLSARAEAKTVEGLEKIKKFVEDHLSSYSQINFDWERQYDIE